MYIPQKAIFKEPAILYYDDYYEINKGYTGTSVGWFLCNDTIIHSLPENVNTAGTICASNGLSWQLQYEDTYYYTTQAMITNALSSVKVSCNPAIYNTICDKVGNLPPYICTRDVYTTKLQAFSSAIAFAHFVLAALIISSSCIFSWGHDRYKQEIELRDKFQQQQQQEKSEENNADENEQLKALVEEFMREKLVELKNGGDIHANPILKNRKKMQIETLQEQNDT